MASTELTPEPTPPQDYRMTIFDFIIDQQSRDPAFATQFSKRLWGSLSLAEREVRVNLAAAFYPNKRDIIGRQAIISSGLMLDFIEEEAGLAHALDLHFTFTAAPRPDATT
jgi:hypothetical protein